MSVRSPVIVTGAPRSGVRLLCALLDAHPALASGPDLPILVTLLQQWQELQRTLGANHAQHFHLGADRVREAFRSAFAGMVEPRLQAEGKRRFVVNSFASTICLDAWNAVFPDCRVIVVVRDPRAVVASLLGCRWRDPRSGRPLPCTVDAFAAARLWAHSTAIALQTGKAAAAAGRLMLLRYEDLCGAPREVLRRMADFIGESPTAPIVRPGSAQQVTASVDNPHPPLRPGPVSRRRPDSTMRSRTAIAVARVPPFVAPLASKLGYSV
jgi:hypothetical protein